MDQEQELANGFEEIRQRFIEKVQGWLPMVDEAAEALGRGETDVDFAPLRMQVHKLAGGAKTFGYPDISESAAEVEEFLDRLAAGEEATAITAPLRTALNALLLAGRAAVHSADAAAASELPAAPAARGSRGTMLIADDDKLICALLRPQFERMGYTVHLVHSGDAVVAEMHEVKPDITLLDVMMPGMNGIDVLRLLKAEPELAALPVLMLSGKSQPDHVVECLKMGALDYIVKPVELDNVFEKVMGVLRRAATEG